VSEKAAKHGGDCLDHCIRSGSGPGSDRRYDEAMVMVEETYLPLTLFAPHLTDEAFNELCDQYSDYRLEYTAEGEVIIMPPADPETGARNAALTHRLRSWALVSGLRLGLVTDSSAGFVLPSHARLSPDTAWISRERLRQKPTCPEFIIELLSPTGRKKVHEKMLEWIANGAELGWMIDPFEQTVSIYRPGSEVEVRRGISEIEGEGPVAGFVLDLREIWNV
jgi:Uma2 family endonuclease